MNAKRTPGMLSRNIAPINRYPVLFAGRNTHVAQVVTNAQRIDEAEANADFIVLAWNAHDELVAALGRASDLVDRIIEGKEWGAIEEYGDEFRAILAKVKE